MSYLPEFLSVATVHLLAVMSPGPDFALVTRNALGYSRQTGVYSALGVGLGILVHVAYCLVGIGVVISQSILLFNAIKWLGAAYLIWIGWQALKAQLHVASSERVWQKTDISSAKAVWMGFLTNALNPKATVFFLALFTQVINPATPLGIQLLYGAEMSMVTFAWFSLVALLFSQSGLKARIVRVQHWIERAMGAVLIALGLKIAFAKH